MSYESRALIDEVRAARNLGMSKILQMHLVMIVTRRSLRECKDFVEGKPIGDSKGSVLSDLAELRDEA